MPTYNVLAEGWLNDARGHGAHYVPAKKGRKPVTIEMTEGQAEYLLASGQIGVPEAAGADEPRDESAAEAPGTVLDPAGAASAEPQAGVAGAKITPREPGALVIGTDGAGAGRSASHRKG